jgi:hypothetical protein
VKLTSLAKYGMIPSQNACPLNLGAGSSGIRLSSSESCAQEFFRRRIHFRQAVDNFLAMPVQYPAIKTTSCVSSVLRLTLRLRVIVSPGFSSSKLVFSINDVATLQSNHICDGLRRLRGSVLKFDLNLVEKGEDANQIDGTSAQVGA